MSFDLHPPFASFPLPMLTAAIIFYLLSFKKPQIFTHASIIAVGMATLCTISAFISGYFAHASLCKAFTVPDDVIAVHHFYGRWTLIVVIFSFIIALILCGAKRGIRVLRVIYMLSLITSLFLVGVTSNLGGELVFKHGAGVTVGCSR